MYNNYNNGQYTQRPSQNGMEFPGTATTTLANNPFVGRQMVQTIQPTQPYAVATNYPMEFRPVPLPAAQPYPAYGYNQAPYGGYQAAPYGYNPAPAYPYAAPAPIYNPIPVATNYAYNNHAIPQSTGPVIYHGPEVANASAPALEFGMTIPVAREVSVESRLQKDAEYGRLKQGVEDLTTQMKDLQREIDQIDDQIAELEENQANFKKFPGNANLVADVARSISSLSKAKDELNDKNTYLTYNIERASEILESYTKNILGA